jgi:hypothetical protein
MSLDSVWRAPAPSSGVSHSRRAGFAALFGGSDVGFVEMLGMDQLSTKAPRTFDIWYQGVDNGGA